jgi:ATP:ADP antiporter, AAA family
LLLYPLILLFCSVGIAVWPLLLFAILIKGGDKSLSYSLNQSARELLYIPIPIKTKYKAKIFIDMFLNRFAKGLGAVILMVFLYLKLDLKYISLVSSFFIIIWLFLNLKVSKQYVETVKQSLITKWERGDKLVGDEVDRDYTKLIFDLLESKDRSKILYAMHLYELIIQNRFTPEIQDLITMESGASRMASMGSLLETDQTTWIPTEDYPEKEDSLEKNIREIMSSENYQTLIKEYIESVLDDKKQTTNTSKMEIAKALGLMPPDTPLVNKLDDLLEDNSPEVVKFAMESVARLQRLENVPVLINKLLDPYLKEDARASLEKFGEKIAGMLSDYILDPSENLELRKALIPILAQTGTVKAVQTITESFQNETSDLSTDIIDALDLLRSNKINLNIEPTLIRKKIFIEIKKYYHLFVSVHDTKKTEFPAEEYRMELNSTLMNIFKLLALLYPREDIYKAYNYLQTGTQDSMAYAIELLDNTLRKEIRDLIIPIVEDIPLKDKIHKIQIANRNLKGSGTSRSRNKK